MLLLRFYSLCNKGTIYHLVANTSMIFLLMSYVKKAENILRNEITGNITSSK